MITCAIMTLLGMSWAALACVANRALKPDAHATRLERLAVLWPLPGLIIAGWGGWLLWECNV